MTLVASLNASNRLLPSSVSTRATIAAGGDNGGSGMKPERIQFKSFSICSTVVSSTGKSFCTASHNT